MPRLKRFLSDVQQGLVPQTFWPHTEVGHTQEAKKELIATVSFSNSADVFDTPKPTRLIERILQIATAPNNDDIVMDFFSGSGTTAHAVMALNAKDGGNRRFIMVQIPEKIDSQDYSNLCEIGKERIRRAGAQMETGDTGFRVFKLDSSNLKTWDAAPIDPQAGDVIGELANRMNAMIHRVKPDRSDLDMVFEVMLKLGVPLDFPVTEVSVNGKTAYSVGEDCLLLVCLTPDIQPEDVEQMAEYAPAKAVISRDSFADDTAMANAWYILRDRGVDLKLV